MKIIIITTLALTLCFCDTREKYPTSYVAETPNGWQTEVTYIYGEIRYLPDGRARARFKYFGGEPSYDSVTFGSNTKITPASEWYVK